jgi:hypothetical protein
VPSNCETCIGMLQKIQPMVARMAQQGLQTPELAMCDQCGRIYIVNQAGGARPATIAEIARAEARDPALTVMRQYQRAQARKRAASSN